MAPSPPNSRLDRILLTLGVITAKLDGVTRIEASLTKHDERLRDLESTVATLKAQDGRSQSAWVLIWQVIHTLVVTAGLVITLILNHHG